MDAKQFMDSLEYLTKAELTPFVWGHAGIGKSSIVKQYAIKKGYHFFPFYLGTQSDLGDILGLADFVRDANGTAVATTFATPEWLKNAVDYCNNNPDSGAIIFLDEFNRARRDILNGMFSLALDKTFHTLKLPKNCHIIAAGNPPTDEYFTTDVNETALMARFVHIKLEPTVSEWVGYAKNAAINPNLIGFIQDQPQLLEQAKTDFDLPVKVDRRSYERLDRLEKAGTPPELFELLMQGIIGLECSVAYKKFLSQTSKPLTGEEVLSGAKTHLLQEWSNPANVLASYLNLTCDNLKTTLIEKNNNKELLTADMKANLMSFLLLIPKDISFVLVQSQVNAKGALFKDFYLDSKYETILIELVKTAKGIIDKAATESQSK